MAEKYIKVMQDGKTSYIPDNRENRNFWTKQNTRLGRSRNSAHELATILPATTEEVAFMTNPVAASSYQPVAPSNDLASLKDMFEKQQQQIMDQQALINKLLLGGTPSEQKYGESEQKEKGKPGPKPKTNNDGKDNETEGSQQA